MALTEEEQKKIKEDFKTEDNIVKVYEIVKNADVDDLKEVNEIPIEKYFPTVHKDRPESAGSWSGLDLLPQKNKLLVIFALLEEQSVFLVDPNNHVTDVTPEDW
tara:strand:+ start:1167 stop:1478 length:312 start_codon:yes stop_codon:yes gene_type:complete